MLFSPVIVAAMFYEYKTIHQRNPIHWNIWKGHQ